jgi:hypothetical protein
MELNKPIDSIDHIANLPSANIPINKSAITKNENIVSVLAGRDLPRMNAK